MGDHHISGPFLALLSFISSPMPVIVGWIRRKYLSRGSRILLALLSLYLFVLAAELIMVFNAINTHYLSQVYSLVEFCTIAAVFLVESENSQIKAAIEWAIFVFCVFWFVAKLTFEPMTLYDNYSSPLAALLVSVMAVHKLVGLLKDDKDTVSRKSMFWISIGIVIYFVGTMPLFALANMLMTRPLEEFANFWKIDWALTILANLIYTKAFTCKF